MKFDNFPPAKTAFHKAVFTKISNEYEGNLSLDNQLSVFAVDYLEYLLLFSIICVYIDYV